MFSKRLTSRLSFCNMNVENPDYPDFYDELTEKDKHEIEIAKAQIKRGEVFSNEEVMRELGKKYKNQHGNSF